MTGILSNIQRLRPDLKKPAYDPKCPVFKWSVKSRDFSIWILDNQTVRNSDESGIQVSLWRTQPDVDTHLPFFLFLPVCRAGMQSSCSRSYLNFYLEKQVQDWTWRSCKTLCISAQDLIKLGLEGCIHANLCFQASNPVIKEVFCVSEHSLIAKKKQ